MQENDKIKENQQNLYQKLILSQQLQNVQVPTRDLDVQIFLRRLKQPICLFGEGPKERKDRLRLLLVHQISDLQQEEKLPDLIPKYEEGSDAISEAKRMFIEFSVSRSKERMKNERKIDQERINETNTFGKSFSNYETYMSTAVDKRPLTSIAALGDVVVVGSLSSKASLWSTKNYFDEPILTLNGHTERITAVQFLNNAIVMTASADGTVKFWSQNQYEIFSLNVGSTPSSLAAHPMGTHALIGLADGSFIVFDVSTQQIISQMKSHDGTIGGISAHRDGGLVITGGADFYGRIWDLRSMKMIKVLQGHSNVITCATFDNDFHALTGSADNSIIIWDLRNLTRSKKISAHNYTISSLSSFNDLIVSSAKDCIKIWSALDFRTYKTIFDCPSSVHCAAITSSLFSNSPAIYTASQDGSLRLYLDQSFDLP